MAGALVRRERGLGRRWLWPFGDLMEDVFRPAGSEFSIPELWSEPRFVPAIDVTEDDETLTLTAEMPGIAREDMDVCVENGVLILRGEKKEETRSEHGASHRLERHYGHFERRIRLPEYVEADRIDAAYKDGVLTLRMPKSERVKSTTIPIK